MSPVSYRSWKHALLLVLAVNFGTTTLMQTAHSAVIDTEAAIELSQRAERIAGINAVLARDDVRRALIDRGVSPDDATARVQMMTDAELQQLEQQLDQLPAGGSIVGVIGIVAIVLVILELLDVTDLFTAF